MAHGILKRLKAETGFNLIEAALALGISGLVFGAVFAAWGSVTTQNKIRKAQEMVTLAVQQLRGAYTTRNSLTASAVSGADFTNALVNAELLPSAWQQSSGAVLNPWNGNFVVTPAVLTASTYDGINITLTSVEKTDCLRLAANVLGSGKGQGLYQIDSQAITTTTNFTAIQTAVCTATTVSFFFSLKITN